ncbi:hypothetical protein TSUD_109860 [Trifolium subterraneum]|uniref:Uncharacterized protein n=1 Tax=Trifolium subterraneum TaxID=3900 RepID=A0A2Z6LY90_TRISU|nr:hypothetical protein TSUD_109860 [Trifolium subterraneum]
MIVANKMNQFVPSRVGRESSHHHIISTAWQNSEEEEFDWEELRPTTEKPVTVAASATSSMSRMFPGLTPNIEYRPPILPANVHAPRPPCSNPIDNVHAPRSPCLNPIIFPLKNPAKELSQMALYIFLQPAAHMLLRPRCDLIPILLCQCNSHLLDILI